MLLNYYVIIFFFIFRTQRTKLAFLIIARIILSLSAVLYASVRGCKRKKKELKEVFFQKTKRKEGKKGNEDGLYRRTFLKIVIDVAETKPPVGKPAAPTAVTGDSSHPTILWQCNL